MFAHQVVLHVGGVAGDHDHDHTDPVRDHRKRRHQRNQCGTPEQALLLELAEQRRERETDDEEMQPRAAARDLEDAIGQVNEIALDMRRNAHELQDHVGDAHGQPLQGAAEDFPDRQAQVEIAKREDEA